MDGTIQIDVDIEKQLQIRSNELGMTLNELANSYLLICLENDEYINEFNTVEDIAKKMNVPLGNKLKEIKETEDLFDIEVLPEKEPLSIEELKKIIREEDDDQVSNVKFTDVLGIVESPTVINTGDEEWRCYRG